MHGYSKRQGIIRKNSQIIMNKLVSIIMNCYNGQKFLEESLTSISNQTYKNWELIFYDNSSKDNSKKIFLKFQKKDKRFKYFKSKKKEKLGLARVNAFKKINGDFFLFFDTDDYLLPKKISTQIKYFNKKKIGAVFSNSLFFNKYFKKKLYKKKIKRENISFYNLIEKYNISLDTVIFKTGAVKKLKPNLDKRFNLIHDLDLIIRLSRYNNTSYCPKILSHWRIHKTSASNNSFLQFANEKKIFEKKIRKLYPKDKKLVKSLAIYRKKYTQEEIIGHLLNKNYQKAKKLLNQIDNRYYKILYLVLTIIPFGNYFTKKIININKIL